ncbi:MAG: trypsin-like serine protease [bacterium]|nr:trypsin-like serine protease [bacterium]
MRKLLSVLFVLILLSVSSICVLAKVQVGEPVLEKFESPQFYKSGSGVVYQQTFQHSDSGYISIHFSKFDLAPGDYVEISNGQVTHRYDGKGKVIDGNERISDFWATHIPGDSAVVKLISTNPAGGSTFEIDQWVRGYEKEYIDTMMVEIMDTGDEAICSSDDKEWAKCYEGTSMYNKSKTVCRLLINGSTACTGWLLGSEGHVMTNNHCIDSQSDANNTDYEFMAEGASCSTSCSSWFACPGTVEATSGTLVKTSSTLDYSLILLPSNLTSTYGYLQLRDTLPTIGERIYIPQHNAAYGKMLAVNSDVVGGFCEIYSTDESPCMGGPGDIGYYADTEGGSSGSPVIAYGDNMVVALHHCANCPNRGVPIPAIIEDLGTSIPTDAVTQGLTDDMFVKFINMKRKADKYARAVVKIKDTDGNNVVGATVSITWSGTVSGTDSGVTNSKGKVVFKSPNDVGGTFTITVNDVVHSSYTYDPGLNIETSDTI